MKEPMTSLPKLGGDKKALGAPEVCWLCSLSLGPRRGCA